MTVSYFVKKAESADDQDDDECPSCFSKRGYLFLFPAKQNLWEAMWCSLYTFGFGYFMPFILHNITASTFYTQIGASWYGYVVVMGLVGYSLFSERCPESAIYSDNEMEFGFGSNHYQRPLYFIIIGLIMLILENLYVDPLTRSSLGLNQTFMRWAFKSLH